MRATAPWLAAEMLSAGSAAAQGAGGSLVNEVKMLFWPGGGPCTKFVTPAKMKVDELLPMLDNGRFAR